MSDENPNNEGGAQPTQAPTDPQAQADTPVTMSALKELLNGFKSEIKTEIRTDVENGVNANLRRSGVFKQAKDEKKDDPQKPPPAAPAAAAISMADVEAMLERERVVTSRVTEHKLGDAAARRMKAALAGIEPDRLATEADAFLSDLGIGKAAATQQSTATAQPVTATQQATQPTAPANPPVSDKGSPTPGQHTPNWKLELGQNPLGMSPAARTAMDAELGVEKARRTRLEAANAQAQRIKVTPKG